MTIAASSGIDITLCQQKAHDAERTGRREYGRAQGVGASVRGSARTT